LTNWKKMMTIDICKLLKADVEEARQLLVDVKSKDLRSFLDDFITNNYQGNPVVLSYLDYRHQNAQWEQILIMHGQIKTMLFKDKVLFDEKIHIQGLREHLEAAHDLCILSETPFDFEVHHIAYTLQINGYAQYSSIKQIFNVCNEYLQMECKTLRKKSFLAANFFPHSNNVNIKTNVNV